MKPLFIPLKKEYFAQFEQGQKTAEYRLYGPRWNENTCLPGRPVTLSCGYGKQKRLKGSLHPLSQGHSNPLTPLGKRPCWPALAIS